MRNGISVCGIETNNLKNIDVTLKKNAINLIIGPSGSGKSSLAYDTIAQIGLHELGAMYYDGVQEPEYKVESYSGMIVTIPIKQMNNNNNVRSTIGTYFSLNPCFAKIFSSLLDLPYDYFVLNKSENVCPKCLGVGYVKKLDHNKIIDYNKSLAEVPIRCWNKDKDFYRQIIQAFCEDENIPSEKKFRQLTAQQKNSILYGEGSVRHTIKYKVTNHFSTKTTAYFGPMTEKPMLKRFSPNNDFFSELLCDDCHGEKYEKEHRNKKICKYSIGELMLIPFDEVNKWIANVRNKYDCSTIEFSLKQIEQFTSKAVELNLSYLFMNRSIPSLSGGELQRLRLIQVFASQLTDLLIVLDEPLAGLSVKEKKIVYSNIKKLADKHTLLIVDHHEIFYNDSAVIIALGEGSGKNGGNLIDADLYLEKQRKSFQLKPLKADREIPIKMIGDVYAYKGVNLSIAEDRLNIISGASGIGKSTLLREYFPQCFDNYIYINQKPMNGNSHSMVATDLDVFNKIINLFAKHFKQEKTFFSNMTSADGVCPKCVGRGYVTYGSNLQSQIVLKCQDCRGTGFNKKLRKFEINGKSLLDIWEMTIDEGYEYFGPADKEIVESLGMAKELLLGHLQIGEKTSDLSGGENIRVKLLRSLDTKYDVYGVDEPFKGLNNEEIYMVVKILSKLVNQGKTVVVVDHEENSFKYFSKHIELKNVAGILTE